MSYEELRLTVNQCTKALLAVGLRRGDRLAGLLNQVPVSTVLYLALCRLGACWVGLNPRHRLPELRYVVEDAQPSLLVAMTGFEDRDYREDIAQLRVSVPSTILIHGSDGGEAWDSFLRDGDAISDAQLGAATSAVEPDDPIGVIYTSGSTGRPKGAVVSQARLLHNIECMAATIKVRPVRLANIYPVDHVAGIQGPYLSILTGGAYLLQERYRAADALELIQDKAITVWFAELPQFVLAMPWLDSYDLSSLRMLHYAGRPPLELLERFTAKGISLVTGYGLTETSNVVLFTAEGVSPEALANHNVGLPIDGVHLRLVSDGGEAIEGPRTGQAQIRSAFLFLEYLNRPDALAAAFTADGWFQTGDILRRVRDESYEFVGRIDDAFKSGGYNVYPREVEMVLEAHPAVAAAVVTGVPSAVYSAVGHAFVVGRTLSHFETTELDRFCRERLANYKVPRGYTVLDAMPLLRNGKFDRALLRTMALEASREMEGVNA